MSTSRGFVAWLVDWLFFFLTFWRTCCQGSADWHGAKSHQAEFQQDSQIWQVEVWQCIKLQPEAGDWEQLGERVSWFTFMIYVERAIKIIHYNFGAHRLHGVLVIKMSVSRFWVWISAMAFMSVVCRFSGYSAFLIHSKNIYVYFIEVVKMWTSWWRILFKYLHLLCIKFSNWTWKKKMHVLLNIQICSPTDMIS